MKKPPLKMNVVKPGPAPAPAKTFDTLEEKRVEINRILDDAEKALQAIGTPYYLAAIDRDDRDPEGGKVYVNIEVTGPDMAVMMQHAFPSNKDLIFLGLAVGNEITRRNKDANIKFREKKRKPTKYHKIDCPKCKAAKMYETDKEYVGEDKVPVVALQCHKCATLIPRMFD